MALLDEIRSYWDEDSSTYDASPLHHPATPASVAAWTAAVARLLPPAPARVLDVGAGTGFLSLTAARLGHRVTALDLSEGMLGRLRESAGREGLEVETVAGPADSPPPGEFDAVMERHLLWTLPDPAGALSAWHEVAGSGTLVLVEGIWGSADPLASLLDDLRSLLGRLRGTPPDHHDEYPESVLGALPLGDGTPPSRLVELVGEAGWRAARLERLRDVEWAERTALAFPERLLGTSGRFAVTARG